MSNNNLTDNLTALLEQTKSVSSITNDDLFQFDEDDNYEEQAAAKKKKFIIYGIAMLLLSAIFALLWKTKANVAPAAEVPMMATKPATSSTTAQAPEPVAQPTTEPAGSTPTENMTAQMDAELQKILNELPLENADIAVVPKEASLAEEQIDRLADEAVRREAQASTLQKTAQTTEAMIALKEKQLAELKAELAKISVATP